MPKERILPGEQEKKASTQEINNGRSQEISPSETASEKAEISQKEIERRREVLDKIAQEATAEEDSEEEFQEKEKLEEIIRKARGGFPIENNERLAQTLGEIILNPKERPGIRKTLEKALEIDPALFDALKDWCVDHFEELVEQGEILPID